jgi:hypothetical protein
VATTHLPKQLHELYEIHEWRHASAVLIKDFSQEFSEICEVLSGFRLHTSRILLPGGSKTLIAGAIDEQLSAKGWEEKKFDTAFRVDNTVIESPTHKIDCYKNKVGLEIEWNNKDPFFDRDLNNFRLLFDLRVLSVGVILTRCDELQDIFNALGKGSSYGNSTTHMSKLLPRLHGGGGGGCPVLAFGIRSKLYIKDIEDADLKPFREQSDALRKSKGKMVGETLLKYVPKNLLSRAKASTTTPETSETE